MTDPTRLLSRDTTERIVQTILGFTDRSTPTSVTIAGWWNGELRWARNRVSLGSDRRDVQVKLTRSVNGQTGEARTNQFDSVSLESAVRMAERAAHLKAGTDLPAPHLIPPILPTPAAKVWSDATFSMTAAERARLAVTLTKRSEEENLLSAGYVEMRVGEVATFDPKSSEPDKVTYQAYTQAQCSVTVRHPRGVGSGWAGLSNYDWSAIDSPALATRALDKCVASLNPVAIEPGRYTAVLEPQAVADLLDTLVFSFLQARATAEAGTGPFALSYDPELKLGLSKLGLKVIDERVSISHDPLDPAVSVLPQEGLVSTKWIDRGVLTSLSYMRSYALQNLNENLGDVPRPAYRMSGGDTSVQEMIETTKRGILVTRLVNSTLIDLQSVLLTGVTRDGMWLIENGKISKSIKNLRYTESPLFSLNQIDQLGPPVPVFHPVKDPYSPRLSGVVVPPIKVKDFSFTALVDAV